MGIDSPEGQDVARDTAAEARTERRNRLVPLVSHALYLAATGFSRGSSLLLVVVLTRLLPVAEYGSFVLVIAVGEVLDSVFGSWIRTALVRDLSAQARSRSLVGPAFMRLCVLSLAGTVLALAVAPLLALGLGVSSPWIFTLATAIYLVANGTAKFGLTLVQIKGEDRRYATIEGARAAASVMAATAAVLLLPTFWAASLAASVVTFAVGVWILFRSLAGAGGWHVPRDGYREDLRLGLPNVANSFLFYGASLTDRFMLQAMFDAQAVALYAAAYTLGRQPVEVVGVAVNVQGFPALSHAYERGGDPEASKTLGACLTLLLLSAGFVIAMFIGVGQQAVTIVLPPSYHAASLQLIPLIMAGTFLFSAMAFGFTNVLHVSRKPWTLLLTTTASVVATLILYVVLIPRYGLLGAALGYAGGATFAMLITYAVARQLMVFTLPWGQFLRVLAALAVAAGVSWWVGQLTLPWGTLVSFLAGGCAGAAVYPLAIWGVRLDFTRIAKAIA